MEFEWDEAKSSRTRGDRGIDFEYAATVFLDDSRLCGFSRKQGGEERHYVIGSTPEDEILYIAYTWRNNGEICRIISARKASKKGRRRYTKLR